jgi:uncharacterized membrane protein
MASCSKCGVSLSGGAAFCASCGAPAGATSGFQSTAVTSNVAGALTYLAGFISGIVFLMIEPWSKDPFVRFHAYQSIFLSIFYILFSIVWGAVFGTLFLVSLGFLWSIITFLSVLLRTAFLLVWLLMMYKAYRNERFSLPFIGPLAAKQAG